MRNAHSIEPDINKGSIACGDCDAKFVDQRNLYRHIKEVHEYNLVQERREDQNDFICNATPTIQLRSRC